MARVASFHLISETRWLTPLALARLATDRPRLARVPGLRFWRLLGTAHADDTAGGADLHRTALFAVWNDETDLEAFLRTHRIARRWGDATEAWHVRLRAAGGHGTWRGVDVLDGLEAGSDGGPLAIITRADVRRRSWRTFRHAARVVDTWRWAVWARPRAADSEPSACGTHSTLPPRSPADLPNTSR